MEAQGTEIGEDRVLIHRSPMWPSFRRVNIFIHPSPESIRFDGAQMDSTDVTLVGTFIRLKRGDGKGGYPWKIWIGTEADLIDPVQRTAKSYSAVLSIRLGISQSLTPAMAEKKNGASR